MISEAAASAKSPNFVGSFGYRTYELKAATGWPYVRIELWPRARLRASRRARISSSGRSAGQP
jgi:hypothetical protein